MPYGKYSSGNHNSSSKKKSKRDMYKRSAVINSGGHQGGMGGYSMSNHPMMSGDGYGTPMPGTPSMSGDRIGTPGRKYPSMSDQYAWGSKMAYGSQPKLKTTPSRRK